MAHLIVHHTVEDFNRWKPIFEGHAATREAAGCRSAMLLRSADDPNDVTLLFDWDSLDHAKAFASSTDLRETMQRAGVLGMPDVTFVNSVEQYPA